MNCQKANSLLSAYLDRELTPEERRQLRLHLVDCNECADELRDLEELKLSLGYLSVASVPAVIPWLQAQLAATGMGEPTSVFAWQQPWFRRTCAVAALLLLFGLSSWLLLPQRRTNPNHNNFLPSLPDASWVSFGRTGP